MSIRLSTAGVKFGYAVETTAGTKPTAGYKYIPELKSIPEINPEPSQLETTTLDELEYKTYIPGLKDLGSALTFNANLTKDFKDIWNAMVVASETAKKQNKETWFIIVIPGFDEAVYFKGVPTELGVPGAEVDAVLEINAYVTPTSAPEWAAAPTA